MKQVNRITTSLNIVVPQKSKSAKDTQKFDRIRRIIGLVLTYAFLIIAAIIVIFPFYYMIIASGMLEDDVLAGQFWPVQGSLFENMAYNYTETLSRFSYLKYVGNTLVVAISTTCLQMLVTILSAFAFARLTFRGRDLLFSAFLATMIIPGEMMVITN